MLLGYVLYGTVFLMSGAMFVGTYMHTHSISLSALFN